jgi:hypothetical protein
MTAAMMIILQERFFNVVSFHDLFANTRRVKMPAMNLQQQDRA